MKKQLLILTLITGLTGSCVKANFQNSVMNFAENHPTAAVCAGSAGLIVSIGLTNQLTNGFFSALKSARESIFGEKREEFGNGVVLGVASAAAVALLLVQQKN